MSELRLLSLVSIACLGFAACSDDDKDNDKGFSKEPLTASELCELYKASSISGELGCVQNVSANDLMGEADFLCTPRGDGTAWATALKSSADANRLGIDWAQARQCTSEARALRAKNAPIALAANPDWQALTRTGVCSTFYTPQVDTGGACLYLWDCKNPNDFCTTDAPYATESFTCRPRGALGDTCNEPFKPCATDLLCNAGTCAAESSPCAGSAGCAPNRDCVAGACVTRGSVELGGACDDEGDSCKDECAVCSKHAAESGFTCKRRSGEGSACEIAADCASDLGCTGGVCTTVPEGSNCGNEDACASGLRCLAALDCAPLDEAGCTANAPYCTYEDGDCRFAAGKCFREPTGGTCLPAYTGNRCADGYDCVTNDTTCRAYATSGQPCDATRVTAPACDEDLACVSGSCVASCDSDSDCASGQYCDTVEPNTCKPLVTDNCTSDAMCGLDKICPAAALVCATHGTAPACSADADCSWSGTACDAAVSAVNHCLDIRKPGETAFGPCSVSPASAPVGQNFTCDSGFCIEGSTGPVCIVVPRGCLDVGELRTIAIPFAFGLVRALRRRKKAAIKA